VWLRMAGWGLLALTPLVSGWGAVYDLQVVTDASPDYGDLPRLVRSATSRWAAPAEKCWAMFYWVNRARRQTSPMEVHGLAVTDPIRQFNDYGYTMCSTVAGMNCALWDAMGFRAKYWDISLHTVPEVEYDGGWHMYDNSMSALYTLCDGRTIAGVADIGKEGACAASEGRVEPGHIARYHCLMATSPNGFLTGADTVRSLEEEARCCNVITGLRIRGESRRETEADESRIEVSTVNGRAWQTVWEAAGVGGNPVSVDLVDEVNGAYEVLVRVTLTGRDRGASV